jgi:hypothetical protein
MAKQQSATDALNVELSKISLAISVAKSFAEKNGALEKALEQAARSCNAAFDQLLAIKQHAREI